MEIFRLTGGMMRKLILINTFILICSLTGILSGKPVAASEKNKMTLISESMGYLSDKNYVEALEKLRSVDSNSLEVKYLMLGLTNPRHWRYGAQDSSLNYLDEYNEILLQLKNASVNTFYYKNLRDFKCAVLHNCIITCVEP